MILLDRKYYRSSSKIDITLDQNVIVTKSYYPKFSFTIIISDLGGSLGFWLGLGINQLCLHCFTFLETITKYFKSVL